MTIAQLVACLAALEPRGREVRVRGHLLDRDLVEVVDDEETVLLVTGDEILWRDERLAQLTAPGEMAIDALALVVEPRAAGTAVELQRALDRLDETIDAHEAILDALEGPQLNRRPVLRIVEGGVSGV